MTNDNWFKKTYVFYIIQRLIALIYGSLKNWFKKGKRKKKAKEKRAKDTCPVMPFHCHTRPTNILVFNMQTKCMLTSKCDRRCISFIVTFSRSHPPLPVEPLGIWLRFPRGVLPLVNLTYPIITSELSFWHFPPNSSFNSSANSQQPTASWSLQLVLRRLWAHSKGSTQLQFSISGEPYKGRTTARPRV